MLMSPRPTLISPRSGRLGRLFSHQFPPPPGRLPLPGRSPRPGRLPKSGRLGSCPGRFPGRSTIPLPGRDGSVVGRSPAPGTAGRVVGDPGFGKVTFPGKVEGRDGLVEGRFEGRSGIDGRVEGLGGTAGLVVGTEGRVCGAEGLVVGTEGRVCGTDGRDAGMDGLVVGVAGREGEGLLTEGRDPVKGLRFWEDLLTVGRLMGRAFPPLGREIPLPPIPREKTS